MVSDKFAKKIADLAIPFSLAAALIFTACAKRETELTIGHGGGYLSAALYAARKNINVDIRQFRSSSDVAYSLLSGVIDVGFVDAERLAAFAKLDGFDRLVAVGKVSYPYGATLVLRKDLNLRLHELNGLTIAASEPRCKLLEVFRADAQRLNADISNVNFDYMPFDAMLAALESRTIDGAVIKGSYTPAAIHSGHTVLYQNWDVQPGDACCPAFVDQMALVLLARREKLNDVQPLLNALLSAQELSPTELRRAVANNSAIPFEILEGQPVPVFELADDNLIKIFISSQHHHHR